MALTAGNLRKSTEHGSEGFEAARKKTSIQFYEPKSFFEDWIQVQPVVEPLVAEPLSRRDDTVLICVDGLEFIEFGSIPAVRKLTHLKLTVTVGVVPDEVILESHFLKLILDRNSLVNGALF